MGANEIKVPAHGPEQKQDGDCDRDTLLAFGKSKKPRHFY
jgi:hypothetical protein